MQFVMQGSRKKQKLINIKWKWNRNGNEMIKDKWKAASCKLIVEIVVLNSFNYEFTIGFSKQVFAFACCCMTLSNCLSFWTLFFSTVFFDDLEKLVHAFFFYSCFRRVWPISDLLTWSAVSYQAIPFR